MDNQKESTLIDIQEEAPLIAEINMTPLIDIMLVLLIIFMVTSSIDLDSKLKSAMNINLPTSSNAQEVKKEENQTPIVISLTSKEEIFFNGIKSNLTLNENQKKELQQKITDLLKKNQTSTVVLEGDTLSKLGNIMAIMDLAKAAGAKDFAIAAEKKAQ